MQAKKAAAPVRILVVDDQRDSADVIATALRQSGNWVLTAYDGTGALAAVEEFQPHVVLLDIDLPDISGYEVATRIRQRFESLLLIASTGRGSNEDRLISRVMGFDYHLQKPYGIDLLLDVLRNREMV